MFYCPPCQKKNQWPESMARSRGRCEACGRTADCYDTPSKYLPVPSDQSESRGEIMSTKNAGVLATYKFDIVAVTTVNVITSGGEDAARQAAASIETYEPGSLRPWDARPDTDEAQFEMSCAAMRGEPYLVDVNPADGYGDDEAVGDGLIPGPVLGLSLTPAEIASMHQALDDLDTAAEGSSNDAEIEAGRECASYLEQLLTILGYPRSTADRENGR